MIATCCGGQVCAQFPHTHEITDFAANGANPATDSSEQTADEIQVTASTPEGAQFIVTPSKLSGLIYKMSYRLNEVVCLTFTNSIRGENHGERGRHKVY